MKYLLVVAIVLLVAWRWRSARSSAVARQQQPKANVQAQPANMVACQHCGLHLPATEALDGQRGSYCSPGHRHAAEG